jgi:hypothetical protein
MKKVETYSDRGPKIDLLKKRRKSCISSCQLSRTEGKGSLGWMHLVKDK